MSSRALVTGLVGAALIGLLGALTTGCTGAAPPPAPTVAVARGTVSSTASATGALSGVTERGPGSVAVLPFAEADAAGLRAGQPARVEVSAVPGLELAGTVLAVAPDAVQISGVADYYVTVVLAAADPRLRAGQTVEATVITDIRRDVLVVPTAAVVRRGSSTAVYTPGPGGEPVRTPIVAGAEGGGLTEVRSGLREGQPVLARAPVTGG
ncbi:MAG TPA: hypothetical protein VGH99_18885 [Pseudonocardia sp.]